MPIMRDTLITMVDYSRWTDDRLLHAVSQLTDDQYGRLLGGAWSAQALISAIARDATTWRTRLEGGFVTDMTNAPDALTLDEARREVLPLYDVLAREATRPADELEELVGYREGSGAGTEVPRWAMLRHVLERAARHRGQLAGLLQLLEQTPPDVDVLSWLATTTS